jgi:hypothetical protein
LAQGQHPVPLQQIIHTVKISDDIRFMLEDVDNGDDNQTNPDPECEPGYVLVKGNCEPEIVCPAHAGGCDCPDDGSVGVQVICPDPEDPEPGP